MTNCYPSPLNCNADLLQGSSLAEICIASQFVVFLSFLDKLIRKNEKISGICERVVPVEKPDDEYDFVVVGGGAGGSIVAARLSENPKWKVLLLEAGPDEPTGSQVPSFMSPLVGSRTDWNYTSTNERYVCPATNGSCSVTAGKMLGGGTGHNGMIYTRGNPTDYNNWAKLGNEGWGWDEVKPYFLKSEDNGEIERVGRFWHATGGPLSVERFPYLDPFGYTILTAGAQAGFGYSEDLDGADVTGCSISQTTTKNGVRRSTARAFLWPARNRKNLHISLETYATRIIIENKKAVGVEYHKNGELNNVRASREVILSAGTIESPHLLLLSGIGPKKHLRSKGIKVVHHLPGVGENLQNHVGTRALFTINANDTFNNDWAAAAEYLETQTGPLSSVGVTAFRCLIASNATTPDYPDMRLSLGIDGADCAPGNIGALRSTGKRPVRLTATYNHPKSRGRITLATRDPFEHPMIHFNYLSDPRDVKMVVEALELGLTRMSETEALRALNFTISPTPLEQCAQYEYPSTEYWTCVAHQGQFFPGHYVGTCKMGPASDRKAVVDPQLRVHGIKGLRIADASIMPVLPSAHTAAPAMMIGERGADFVKENWK